MLKKKVLSERVAVFHKKYSGHWTGSVTKRRADTYFWDTLQIAPVAHFIFTDTYDRKEEHLFHTKYEEEVLQFECH